ncbi:hypothetical protein C1645_813578 [Glomus cerebriforme]|uniref:F-box domain-containing protein n=1 Tax=Glomus cerebriforme TaxID=658196 RepID=A0A397THZ7_9GLOM|nr:hypothetical protein C1645_813578 [Glomus cerebriforme]
MAQLLSDILNEIFEYLEDDMITLRSCLLVNHLWCEASLKIFWRNVWNYKTSNFRTLIACLPNKSKEILNKNGINISVPTSKPPMFNYAKFCKVLPVHQVSCKLEQILKDQSSKYFISTSIVTQEIFKLFMSQIGSLKELEFWKYSNTNFEFYPGSKDCLKNLTELRCSSSISSEFFSQLFQICQNIRSLSIGFRTGSISNGLIDLISVQKNLKDLSIYYSKEEDLKNIIPSIMKPDNLNKLRLYGISHRDPLSFITKFINLQQLELLYNYSKDFKDDKKLQYIIFPQLQILKIKHVFLNYELLIKFLENNGKNLKEFYYVGNIEAISNNSLNLSIAKFCPNLRKLSVGFKNSELETLKIIYESCQYLKSIKIWCGGEFLSEKVALESVVNYSHKNIYEIILYHISETLSKLLPEELESFFISWANRVPQKSLSLIIINKYGTKNSLDTNIENMKIIEKYGKLSVIKRFKTIDFDDDLN